MRNTVLVKQAVLPTGVSSLWGVSLAGYIKIPKSSSLRALQVFEHLCF